MAKTIGLVFSKEKKLTKAEIIENLTELGIDFDEKAKAADLYELLINLKDGDK